ncbi:multicopper oxidase domain-containing protein [Heyndrickxia ginsengihumi]|uniref:Multicopper oxidase domain-containing protein n=1 Tax=Heyndrickxia ginsengihumi TaxID=363870 RepID=A0A6M0P4F5_9BACI|nr:multicopper oxidase domain-containing protein [Heyndrickxia ginsengihumi]MCM3024561.1 multicopper oxidase domain-containing protein [Heyndrickxia ginsengihumi]NEY18770.1 multicopper oxidase domain-containing protein [Heyndrickxia ginsengihumi]
MNERNDTMKRWSQALSSLIMIMLLVFIAAGCQSSNSTDSSKTNKTASKTVHSGKVEIDMKNMAFSPKVVYVTEGTKVTWKNKDAAPHNVVSNSGAFKSKELSEGKTFSYTFNKKGTYKYKCTYHAGMDGTVIVTDKKQAMTMETMSSTEKADSKGKTAPLGTGTSGEPKQADGIRLLPYKMVNGYKVFHLNAKQVWWEVKPGKKVKAWAYNGTVPGPEIKVNQGDKVKIIVKNDLSEGTTVHWHGLDVPFKQDGTGGVSQPDIKPGETWTYTFTVNASPGTYAYHSHPMKDMLKQEQMGLFGAFIVEPKGTGWKQVHPGYQKEYTVLVNDSPQFGYTINGRSYPATPVLPAKVGDKILVHLINIGSMVHPMHLHGMHFQEISQDGVPLPSPVTMDTIATAPGTTYDISFNANQVGKWLFHCHITDHVVDSNGDMSGMITTFDVKK